MTLFRPPESTELTAITDVRARVLALCAPLDEITVPTRQAHGLALAQPALALAAVPPFDTTSMDGFAVRASDTENTPCTLSLLPTIEAGGDVSSIGVGNACAIMTGAPLPIGADAVVPFELVASHDDHAVTLTGPIAVGSFVREKGGDTHVGDVVVERGTWLRSHHVSALVASGVTDVCVHRRPRIAVVTTGRELNAHGNGGIPDSNAAYLELTLLEAGFDVNIIGAVDDDASEIARALLSAARNADAIITTGGVGPGERDLLPTVAATTGTIQRFSVAMKPGKPFALGSVHAENRDVPLFCLPGNPVSTIVSLEVLVMAGLRRMAGREGVESIRLQAVTSATLERRTDDKVHYLRGIASRAEDDAWKVVPVQGQASHQIVSAASANCLIEVFEEVLAGSNVTVILL